MGKGRRIIGKCVCAALLSLGASLSIATASWATAALDEGDPPLPSVGIPATPSWTPAMPTREVRRPTPPPPPTFYRPPASAPSTFSNMPTTALPAPSAMVPFALIRTVRIDDDQVRLMADSGQRLAIKTQFILSNPSRLVIDIPNAKLADPYQAPIMPGSIGSVPVASVRVGQFTEYTVRVVIETPEPDRLTLHVDDNRLAVAAERSRGVFGSISHWFGHSERPAPQREPRPLPPSASPSGPRMAADDLPPMSTPPRGVLTNSSRFPQFQNIQKLQQMQRFQLIPSTAGPMTPPRARILEIARSQLGLSKDSNRDYVNQTFSKGRDNAWCADFVSTIMDWAGGSPWGHYSRVQDIYEWGVSSHHLTNRPEAADLVILTYGTSSFDHVAFVESVNPDNTITTIGGNEGYAAAAAASVKTSGTVSRSVYNLDDRRILGFVDPLTTVGLTQSLPPALPKNVPLPY